MSIWCSRIDNADAGRKVLHAADATMDSGEDTMLCLTVQCTGMHWKIDLDMENASRENPSVSFDVHVYDYFSPKSGKKMGREIGSHHTLLARPSVRPGGRPCLTRFERKTTRGHQSIQGWLKTLWKSSITKYRSSWIQYQHGQSNIAICHNEKLSTLVILKSFFVHAPQKNNQLRLQKAPNRCQKVGNPGIMKEASFFPHPGTTQQDLFLRPCLERLALVASRGAAGSPGDDGGAV